MIEVGLGAAEVLAVAGTGRVLRRSGDTAWLRLPAGICGVAAPEAAPPGPLWIRGAFPWRGRIDGAAASGAPGGVDIAGVVLPLERARLWRGGLPRPEALRTHADVAIDALEGVRPSRLVEPPLAGVTPEVVAALEHGDLAGAARLVGGLGPGLTPAGDDVLGGILMAARALRGPTAEPDLLAVATGVATSELAIRFLVWAARGQHIGPVHDLLAAAAVSDRPGARAATRRLAGFGSSSGADVAFGLRLGLAARQPATTTSTSETARRVLET